MAQRTVVTSDIGRVFYQNGQGMLSCCPEYLGCVGVSGISQERGEALTIKCLSDKKTGEYTTIEKIAGTLDDVTFDLTSYLGLNGVSVLRKGFQDGCLSTIHIHFGVCANPQDFTQFDKAIVLDDVLFNSYSTDDLITLDSEGRSVVTETVSAEAVEMYEYFAERKFTLVSKLDTVEPFELHLLGGKNCSVCVFCPDCTLQQCTENFYTIPQDGSFVASFNDWSTIYTVEENGTIKQWNSESILDGEVSCSTIANLTMLTGETVTSAALDTDRDIMIIGTSSGRVIFYNIKTGAETAELILATSVEITSIQANEFGYLVGTNTGAVYYSEEGEFWEGPTTVPSGIISAMWLYSGTSWLVATSSGMYYTNDSGDNYSLKSYQSVNNDPITMFAQSNTSILHAINTTYYYQSYDAGCNWQAIDLSKYFSELYSVAVCPTNPFVVYLAGLSVDGTESYIVSINFGA